MFMSNCSFTIVLNNDISYFAALYQLYCFILDISF